MITPWTIHEAEIALYPAWQDGMPFRGPGEAGGVPAPIFSCKSSLSVSGSPRKTAAASHDWTGNPPNADGQWDISISFPEGAHADGLVRAPSRLHAGGLHVLVVRFIDAASGHWSCLRWYYVTWESDESSPAAQILSRTVSLRSTWMQETVGADAPPSLSPVPYGEVDWICASRRITCCTFDPETETWLSLPRNQTADGGRYVNFSPLEDSVSDVVLSACFPRAVPGTPPPGFLATAVIEWQSIPLLSIGNHESEIHHGLTLLADLALQDAGIVEPLFHSSQARMFEETIVVFRYLRRVYACIGHGVLAVPALTLNQPPPFTHDYPFRLAVPGDPNPATGQSGLTLLPAGAWLDGTLA
jgi:hypothetical protein